MELGYVKLWRKCLDSGLLQNGPAWQLFGYLLLKTTYRHHRQIVAGMVFDLEPGEVIFGRAKAASDLGLSEKQVRTAFELLKKLEIVSSRSTNRCTVVSFLNWHRYQDERPAEGQQKGQQEVQQRASRGPAEGQQRATNKKDIKKESKKEERKTDLAQSDAGASSAPEPDGDQEQPVAMIPLADGSDFPVPASLASEYAAAYPGVDVAGELAQVRAWCLSNPRKRKTKTGVRRFLNSWLDRAQNNASRSSPIQQRAAPMTARQVEAAERGDFAEQVLKLDEVYRNGEFAAFGSGTQQSVCALSAAEARAGGIRVAGQDLGRRVG